ncbi:rhodanese-like domain-containing protein [Persicirhabdus sediminis]|uniref:Rhodanese-like domain-containing protein n=1 Tax=Persicirhabdus sediminis TaxID=454144 RepID=A0A8J7MEB3_9BACT|nr:rhodanese-like domain-containing protein [Persicirhabdus sediminis]MBK1792339.1 rhodanese-like domain-containing protein [Persicirhabdus sediminis]
MNPVKTILQACAITIAALIVTAALWFTLGEPERTIPCDPATLSQPEICLQTVINDWANENVLWVDARLYKEWQTDGMPDSVLLSTDDEEHDYETLLGEAAERIITADRVVIYCKTTGCGTSKAIANKLIADQMNPNCYALHGGWQALQAAGY